MKILDFDSHAEHRYNRFILCTLFPKVWQEFLDEEPWVRATLSKNILRKSAQLLCPNSAYFTS